MYLLIPFTYFAPPSTPHSSLITTTLISRCLCLFLFYLFVVLFVRFQVQIKTYSICSSLSHFKITETQSFIPSPLQIALMSFCPSSSNRSGLPDSLIVLRDTVTGWSELPGVLTFGLAHTSFPLLMIKSFIAEVSLSDRGFCFSIPKPT